MALESNEQTQTAQLLSANLVRAVTPYKFSKKNHGMVSKFRVIDLKSNLDSSNTDGSFNMSNSNSYFCPYEILPIALKNKNI